MTTKDETIFKVPKLLADGSNWVTYRDRLRWALSAQGLLDNITDSIPEPMNPTVNDPPPDPSDTAAIAAHTNLNRGYAIRIKNGRRLKLQSNSVLLALFRIQFSIQSKPRNLRRTSVMPSQKSLKIGPPW